MKRRRIKVKVSSVWIFSLFSEAFKPSSSSFYFIIFPSGNRKKEKKKEDKQDREEKFLLPSIYFQNSRQQPFFLVTKERRKERRGKKRKYCLLSLHPHQIFIRRLQERQFPLFVFKKKVNERRKKEIQTRNPLEEGRESEGKKEKDQEAEVFINNNFHFSVKISIINWRKEPIFSS